MKIGKTRVAVSDTNLSELDVRGIVNPANNMLWFGGGLSAEIRKYGGKSIENEALQKAPAGVGEAVVTGAGDLKARWIIHAVISDQNLITHEEIIRNAVKASLIKAGEIGSKSLAFPLFVTGTHDVEVHVIIHSMVDETMKYLLNENHSLEYVVFIDKAREIRDIFTATLIEKFTKHG